MYRDRGVTPTKGMAGMMAAAILSDTVMFKSPTCTERDKQTAQRMARLADISLEELGKEIFSASAHRRSARELLDTDYKEFHIAGIELAVSQITCMDSPELMKRREEFLMLMEQTAKEKGFSMVLLMLTDVLLEGTQLLFVGDEEIIRQAFNKEPKDGAVFLPQIMSRKKQVIPMLSALWG
jgi:manganese-dependent inorganic pyrophosphatase